MTIQVSLSFGELLDKLSILEIKSERIKDPGKIVNVRHERNLLQSLWQKCDNSAIDIQDEWLRLKKINETLWEVEDHIRDKERKNEFDDEFIQLARMVYFTNDERAAVKRALNLKLGSQLIEEKSYQDYSQTGMALA